MNMSNDVDVDVSRKSLGEPQEIPEKEARPVSRVIIALAVLAIAFLGYKGRKWIKPVLSPESVALVQLVPIVEGSTGGEVCFEKKMSCISVAATPASDPNGRFFGLVSPSCRSRLVHEPTCMEDFGTSFAIYDVVYDRSPEAEGDVEDLSESTMICLVDEKGKAGIYEHAFCAELSRGEETGPEWWKSFLSKL